MLSILRFLGASEGDEEDVDSQECNMPSWVVVLIFAGVFVIAAMVSFLGQVDTSIPLWIPSG